MKVVVVLVAYCEARNCGPVIEAVRAQGLDCILVDDGSSDETAALAREHGAEVVRHCLNLGQGRAVVTGFKAALTRDCDAVIIMDADGQHDPADLPRFIEMLRVTNADIISGSRALGGVNPDASPVRRVMLPVLTRFLNRLAGLQLTDCMCGYRAYRRDTIAAIIPVLDGMLEPQYMTPEMLIRFGRAGLRVVEVPVHLRARAFGTSTKGLARYAFGVTRAIVRTYLAPT